ncbi:hypothetical protein PFICI_14398 [Pestalotiopsis fici W106-1]|uniref:Zn(2)-C6 fungal-type domain-containing protein n=1 Tax=Pestalotiopsis fici (strain W106-1 / CGMCC3.15140) TaxID=1229662 RepID=W3WMY7_PESFW|nr:uncharacterized protein PFICI_14398 [Pestalotiopsis fici W106-1]ETS74532.1 hypothetical protein PFICI_14398 [Pestalotiopsis fici W106-1]
MQTLRQPRSDTDEQQDIGISLACLRCRKRKIKCDRKNPCAKCRQAGAECDRGPGEKLRPTPKSYVQALESQVASLEILLRAVADADNDQRASMLAEYGSDTTASALPSLEPTIGVRPLENSDTRDGDLARARAKMGQLRRLVGGGAAQFYGGTSLLQISLSGESQQQPDSTETRSTSQDTSDIESQAAYSSAGGSLGSPSAQMCYYEPHNAVAQELMVAFFKHQYPFNMSIHREYFIREYHEFTGRRYSDVLICAICATGALATDDVAKRSLAEVYLQRGQQLVQASLDHPDITLLQALLLLGQCEIGRGRTSRGWLLCGMAFRLTHEMGLHLDPSNWVVTPAASAATLDNEGEEDIDREIFRRVYWAAFALDKQLSLFFGRPPALHTYESDVRNPVRLPYPPNWKSLLDSCGIHDNSVEDGVTHVEAFIHQAELSKILHRMITGLFENRRSNPDDAMVVAMVQQINVSLNRWLMTLPSRLHWNQWSIGQIPASVIHLHFLFHTAMITLHRPPRNLWSKPGVSTSDDVEICYESATAILRLIRSYKKYYQLCFLPLDFAYTLSTTAGVVLMRRHFENLAWDHPDIARQLSQLLQAMDEIKGVWPCIVEVKDSILRARDKQGMITAQPNASQNSYFIPHFFNINDYS